MRKQGKTALYRREVRGVSAGAFYLEVCLHRFLVFKEHYFSPCLITKTILAFVYENLPRPGSVIVERSPGMREVAGSTRDRVKKKDVNI